MARLCRGNSRRLSSLVLSNPTPPRRGPRRDLSRKLRSRAASGDSLRRGLAVSQRIVWQVAVRPSRAPSVIATDGRRRPGRHCPAKCTTSWSAISARPAIARFRMSRCSALSMLFALHLRFDRAHARPSGIDSACAPRVLALARWPRHRRRQRDVNVVPAGACRATREDPREAPHPTGRDRTSQG